MKRQEREVYGYGARFTTRQDRASRVAAVVLVVAVAGMLAGVLWSR